jgi:subtilisin family serine protease
VRRFPFVVIAILTLMLPAGPLRGEPARLDARARAAFAELPHPTGARPGPRAGVIGVFVRGTVSRADLAAAGAVVRTSLPGLHTAFVTPAALPGLLALPGVAAVHGSPRLEPELDASVPTTGAPLLRGGGPDFPGLNGAGVLVGIVDSGVDLDHGDFRDASGGTRIVSLWDQTTPGTPPAGHAYGSEWSAAQIDAGLCPQTDGDGHGTHVLGIAAGDGSQTGGGVPAFTFAGLAPRADLVVVKTDYDAASIVDGVRYVFERAAARGQPAVVNLSVGTQEGPHDGTSDLEAGLTALTGPGRIVVKSAGNDRGSGRHAEVLATPGGASVTFFASGSVPGGFFVVDGWYAGSERLRARVTTPNGTVFGPVAAGEENAAPPGVATANGTVHLAHDSLVTGVRNVRLAVQIASGQNVSGTWTVTFLADQLGPANGEVDLWRSAAAPGVSLAFVAGNQSGEELISEPGNAAGVITVASWATRQGWTACNGAAVAGGGAAPGLLSAFSSPGPTRDGRPKPDLAAPGEYVLSATSFDLPRECPPAPAATTLAADDMNHVALRGTSMAAPHVTGAVALLLAKRGALTPAQVTAHLAAEAMADAFTGAVWNADWGAGKLRLGDLIDPVPVVVSPNGGEEMVVGGTATVEWSATDSLGVVASVDLELSRTGPAGPFAPIATGLAHTGSFEWTVTGPPTAAGAAWMRVRARDGSGNAGEDLGDAGFTIHSAVDTSRPAPAFGLDPVAPNPARPGVTIAFTLAATAAVRLEVLDLQGRVVAVLADGVRGAGPHRVVWDGGTSGAAASSGLYFVRYRTPAGTFRRRLALLR